MWRRTESALCSDPRDLFMNAVQPSGPVVIAGGSGFLGLTSVIFLGPSGPAGGDWPRCAAGCRPVAACRWDARTLGDWQSELDGASGLVNLAGPQRRLHQDARPSGRNSPLARGSDARAGPGRAHASTPAAGVGADEHRPHLRRSARGRLHRRFAVRLSASRRSSAAPGKKHFTTSVLPSQRQVILRTSFVLGRDRGAARRRLRDCDGSRGLGWAARVGSGTQGHELDP